LVLWASSAYAHVTVQPKQATAKGFQEYVVRVPTEKDTPTLSIRMVFPEGFEVLRFRPAPGWKYEVERDASGRITGVTWSGDKIGREEYEQFSFMARAANPGTYQLNAYQTYGSGEVVSWVNPQEPQPAPKVIILAAAQSAGGPDPFAASAGSLSGAPPPAAAGSRAPMLLASASVVFSITALVLAGRRRR
jgi:YD repeat-containing protein